MVPQAVLLAVAVAMASAMVYLFDAFLTAGKKLDELQAKVVLKADLEERAKTLTEAINASASAALTQATNTAGARLDEMQAENTAAVGKVKADLETVLTARSDGMVTKLTAVEDEVLRQKTALADANALLSAHAGVMTDHSVIMNNRIPVIRQLQTDVEAVKSDQTTLRASLEFVEATANETYDWSSVNRNRIEAAERDVAQNTLLRRRFEYAGTGGPVSFCDLDGDNQVGCRAFSFLDAAPPAAAA